MKKITLKDKLQAALHVAEAMHRISQSVHVTKGKAKIKEDHFWDGHAKQIKKKLHLPPTKK